MEGVLGPWTRIWAAVRVIRVTEKGQRARKVEMQVMNEQMPAINKSRLVKGQATSR
jgi:hypothetical protein